MESRDITNVKEAEVKVEESKVADDPSNTSPPQGANERNNFLAMLKNHGDPESKEPAPRAVSRNRVSKKEEFKASELEKLAKEREARARSEDERFERDCPICMTVMVEPCKLPCGHRFCI